MGQDYPDTGPSPGTITRPSIPPPFHWCEEKCPKSSSQDPYKDYKDYADGADEFKNLQHKK